MDAAAFSAIVAPNRRRLYGCARRVVGDAGADDVVQTALLAAWLQASAGTAIADPMAWLFRIVRNTAINALQRAPGRHEAPLRDWMPDRGDVVAEVERSDELRRALAAVAELPPRQRDALIAAAAGSPPRAIAGDLGISSGAVRVLLHRGRTEVRRRCAA